MNTESPQSQNLLKESVLERIDHEHVCPRSRLFFRGQECLVWVLWLFSVLVGALAVAVSLFIVNRYQYEIYEFTHASYFMFMVDVLPYLWITIFGLMVYVAIINLRHTKRGYRYPVQIILLSSVILGFAGGSVLHLFGFGAAVDNTFGRHVKVYMSQDKVEQKIWQSPSEGRLIGKQILTTLVPTSTVVFEDVEGVRWRMDVSELPSQERELLASKIIVRLVGEEKDKDLHLFHACGVFPRSAKSGFTKQEVLSQRRQFVERFYQQNQSGHVASVDNIDADSAPSTQGTCARLSFLQNLPARVTR